MEMAVAAAVTVAASVASPASQSSLLVPGRPSAFASKPSFYSPLRASSATRSAAIVLSHRQPGPRLAAATPEGGDIEVEVGNGGGGESDGSDRGSGGGAGRGDSGESEGGGSDKEKKGVMSMSQKLTLAYAALVGVGGIMGYIKGGSQKSLAAGGISALLLYYVYTQLPVRPAFASSVGLGVSAALLAVMGPRFKKSGKIFPAGVVSLVSLVMTGGYFHGILRSSHV